jgi:hypothetical protein
MWRLAYFWFVLKKYALDLAAYGFSGKSAGFERVLRWDLEPPEGTKEYHEGTFWQFVKWLVTHEKIFS